MCGICGFNWEDKELLKGMTRLLRHRGPDGGGLYTNKDISLGHRRLSIIDLSSAGAQPMTNEEGDIFIVYNGEIYNFLELRGVLEQKGHKFKSDTDTEVIIHAYEEWGENCLSYFNGMFAFAIWDEKKKQLFLARDRLGVKPLYYHWNGEDFIFGSEIKAILFSGIKREVNLKAVKNYLNLRYIPGEETLFKGVKKLMPGHALVFKEGKVEIKSFWDVPVPVIREKNLGGAASKIRELLTDAVQKRLVADVPVGVYLSGGIDSAAITALAAKMKEEPVKTFSVGFDHSEEVDELAKAREIAQHFGTEHQEIVVGENVSEMLPKIIWHLDMPHGDPVVIPQFKLSELAAKKVKVVLSGDGADEIFGGYVQYRNFLLAQKGRFFPSGAGSMLVRGTPVKILDKFFDYPSSMGEKGKEKVGDFIIDLKDKEEAYEDLTSITSKKDRALLFTDKIKELEIKRDKFQLERKPLLNQLLYYDIKRWLPNYILFINDRMTMANSIEGRTPFLDYRLVEYSTTLPAQWKLKGGVTKFILREAMGGVLPQVGEKKHAFFMPLDKWYKEGLRDLTEKLFTPNLVKERGYFNYYYLKRIWENYDRSKLIYGKQLFTLINFELWHRMFIDGEKIPRNDEVKLSSLI